MALYGTRVEYALHTLLNLRLGPDDVAPSAKDLAEFQKLPLPFMRKLLTQLEKAGLVRGAKGVRGGWRLARAAEDISVLEVADAAQGGSPRLFECQEIRAKCALWPDDRPPDAATSGVCEIHRVMLAAEAEMRRHLAAESLADIERRVLAKTGPGTTVRIEGWFTNRYETRVAHNPEKDGG